MTKREFSLEHILYCVATALGRKGYCDTVPSDLHKFLTGTAPSFAALEEFATTTVACGLALLEQHPQLKAVEKSLKPVRASQDAFEDDRPFRIWLANQEKKFGKTLEVAPISTEKRKRFAATARGIALRNFEAKGINLNDKPYLGFRHSNVFTFDHFWNLPTMLHLQR